MLVVAWVCAGYIVGMATTHTDTASSLESIRAKTTQAEQAAADEAPSRVKITAELPTRDNEELGRIAKLTGYNKVTTLVRAIRVLALLEDAKDAGGRIVVEKRGGERSELLLP